MHAAGNYLFLKLESINPLNKWGQLFRLAHQKDTTQDRGCMYLFSMLFC
uniref:Uncharacterized protein n=1 Tax=Arundo donax TaxID=35708 RepID=A0A0A9H4Y6_ARUDO